MRIRERRRLAAALASLLVATLAPSASAADACGRDAKSIQALVQCVKAAHLRFAENIACRAPDAAFVQPVIGRPRSVVGDIGPLGTLLAGTTIEAPPGAEVVAPVTGQVLYAEDWRSYGPVLIIGAECGADVVVTGSIEFSVKAGARVRSGERVGGLKKSDVPIVYFELRPSPPAQRDD